MEIDYNHGPIRANATALDIHTNLEQMQTNAKLSTGEIVCTGRKKAAK